MSLGYLQEKFRFSEENMNFLKSNHFEILANTSVLKLIFKSVSNEYLNWCKHVQYEFVNENGQIEIQNINIVLKKASEADPNRTYFLGWVCYTLIEIIDGVKNVFTSCDNLKELAYENYKVCFKSVILYGLDIEKILFLDCLKKIMTVKKVKSDFYADVELVNYLRSLQEETANSNDNLKIRLNLILRHFLE